MIHKNDAPLCEVLMENTVVLVEQVMVMAVTIVLLLTRLVSGQHLAVADTMVVPQTVVVRVMFVQVRLL